MHSKQSANLQLLAGGWSNNTLNLAFCHSEVIFAICQLHYAHMRKDARLFPLFCTASDEKLGRGPRKEGAANLQHGKPYLRRWCNALYRYPTLCVSQARIHVVNCLSHHCEYMCLTPMAHQSRRKLPRGEAADRSEQWQCRRQRDRGAYCRSFRAKRGKNFRLHFQLSGWALVVLSFFEH